MNSAVHNAVTVLSPVEAAALCRENKMLKLQLAQANAKLTNISMNQVDTFLTISVYKSELIMSRNRFERTNAVSLCFAQIVILSFLSELISIGVLHSSSFLTVK